MAQVQSALYCFIHWRLGGRNSAFPGRYKSKVHCPFASFTQEKLFTFEGGESAQLTGQSLQLIVAQTQMLQRTQPAKISATESQFLTTLSGFRIASTNTDLEKQSPKFFSQK